MEETKNSPESETKELAKTDKKALKKAKKEAKVYPVKKLPSLFKKSYRYKNFNKKILAKLYIDEDKKKIDDLFKQGGNPKKADFWAVPKDSKFNAKDLAYYKKIAKEIKAQKGLFRLVPLAAVAAFIFSLVTIVGIFKNPLVKKGLKAACEAAFGAKTEIGYVDLRILKSRLTVGYIAVGNKNSVMKNLFEVEKLELAFNLPQLLRKRFVAENLEVSGMKFNTDRKTSCELPKKPESAKSQEESAFVKSLKAKSANAIEDLKSQAFALLGASDVDSIVEGIRSQIKSTEAAKAALEDSKALLEKWKAKPEEIEKQVKDFSDSIKDLQAIKVSSFNVKNAEDLKKLSENLEKIKTALDKSKELKSSTQNLLDEIKADGKKLSETAESVKSAAESDIAFAKERLTTITGALSNASQLLNTALDTVGYNMMGKYYPYVQKAIAYAKEAKAASAAKEKTEASKKTEKKVSRRLKGTTYWYSTTYPSFLIENVLASGTGFSARITEITNNQDWRNKPTVFTGSLTLSEIDHNANITLDTRTKSTAPLISASYTGKGFTAAIDGASIAKTSGIPSLNGKAVLNMTATADSTGFTAGGNIDLNPLTLTSDGFDNEIVTKYYKQALEQVSSMKIGFEAGYTEAKGAFLDLTGNFAEQFINALKNVIMTIGQDAKNAALKKIQDEINSSSNEVLAKVKDFLGLEEDIDLQNTKLSDLQGILEKKKVEIEEKLKEKANEKIDEAKSKATEKAAEKVKDLTGSSDAAEKAGDAAKSLLNGLKKK